LNQFKYALPNNENQEVKIIDIDINESTMQIDKDERVIQDINIDNELSKMGLEDDIVKEKMNCTMTESELEKILQDDHEIEKEDTFLIDNVIDAYRVNTGSMRGKCIIDFEHVFKQLHEKFDEHCHGIECSFRDLTFIGVRAYGLKHKFFFKCRMCNFESNVWSEPSPEKSLDINTGAVASSILTGVGYTQLQQSCAAMNISCMGRKTYEKTHEIVAEAFAKAAEQSMKTAANEERELALQRNEVINGIPYIAVIGDGSWMKRSYRTGRYDSLSGVGTIIGARTGKVLHMAVRNKYCAVCVKAENLEKEPPNHKCYKNWAEIVVRLVWKRTRSWKDLKQASRNIILFILHILRTEIAACTKK